MRTSSSLLALALSSAVYAAPFSSRQKRAKAADWPGWAGIKHMIVFGDSYTSTSFNDTLTQPSASNPLGNPAYPGYTSSNGPNWVDFITTTYNRSLVETVNLAYGGATVDSALVAPYQPTVLSVQQQVETEYLPVYSSQPSFFPWRASDTLFSIFIGINDVGNSYYLQDSSLNDAIFAVYSGLVDTLYTTGARNFLFLNVPPVDRSPLTVGSGAAAAALQKTDIADFNTRVAGLVNNLTDTYKDTTTFLFDTNALFTQVLDDPCSNDLTCPYKNVTDYCDAYENGTSDWYSFDANCGISVDKYFWLNSLHPTFRMHNATARAVVEELTT